MFRGQHGGSKASFESIGAKDLRLSVALPTFCRDRGPGFGRDRPQGLGGFIERIGLPIKFWRNPPLRIPIRAVRF